MVYIPPWSDTPRLNAYVLPSFPIDELAALKRAFELGTCAPFSTMLELVIQHAPADYADATFEDMRKKENEAGRKDAFVIIDARGAGGREGVVWYVDQFATQDEVDDGEATSTDVVWRIPVKTECLALMWVNYDIANMSLQEDLTNLDVDFPVDVGYEVNEVDDCGGLDMMEQRYGKDTLVIAYPGEFEESTDEAHRKNYMPRPDKVARLKEGLAETVGLVNRWTIPGTAQARNAPEGGFPEGSISLQLSFDPDFNWPEYKWPEGSL